MTIQKNMPPASDPPAEAESPLIGEPSFGLVQFLRIIHIRRRVILGTAIIVVALVTAIVLQLTPLYSATAVVMLDQRKNNLEDTAAVLSGLPADPTAVQNQVQILTSLGLAEKVVSKLNLDRDPEFSPKRDVASGVFSKFNPLKYLPFNSKVQVEAQGADPERTAIIHTFLGHLAVSPIGLSTAINVTFKSQSAQKAAFIANAIADAYVNDQLTAKYEATQRATQWLTVRVADLSRQAQAADEAVQKYKSEHNITTITTPNPEGSSVVEQQIANVNQQLVTAKADLAEKRANYQHLSELALSGNATNAAQVLSSPVIAQLRTQEAQLTNEIANNATKYGPKHPKMLDLQAQKANLDARIADEVHRIVEATKNDVEIASSHVDSLQQSLREAEHQGAGQNEAQVQLSALQSAATSARTQYETLLKQLNQTQGQEGIQTADARIISKAELPQSPSFPKKTLTIGVAIPAGLALGLLLAFFVDRLDSGFRTASDIEAVLGIPVLTTVPEVEGIGKVWSKAVDLVIDKPMSVYAESMRGLQLGLSLSNLDHKPQVVLVTSSVPGEGKTTIAISLARTAAHSGLTTLLVDADLRRPSLARTLGCKKLRNGIIEALTNKAPTDQCLTKDPRSNVWLLPCVRSAANPMDILASETFRTMIEGLRRVFDLVIIDSAPLLPVNDTRVIGRLADAVLLVTRWQRTPRDAVVNALRALINARAPAAGVALARADYERFRYYSYGYQDYYSHSKYYHD